MSPFPRYCVYVATSHLLALSHLSRLLLQHLVSVLERCAIASHGTTLASHRATQAHASGPRVSRHLDLHRVLLVANIYLTVCGVSDQELPRDQCPDVIIFTRSRISAKKNP